MYIITFTSHSNEHQNTIILEKQYILIVTFTSDRSQHQISMLEKIHYNSYMAS